MSVSPPRLIGGFGPLQETVTGGDFALACSQRRTVIVLIRYVRCLSGTRGVVM